MMGLDREDGAEQRPDDKAGDCFLSARDGDKSALVIQQVMVDKGINQYSMSLVGDDIEAVFVVKLAEGPAFMVFS